MTPPASTESHPNPNAIASAKDTSFEQFEAEFRAHFPDHNQHGAEFEPVVKWLLENHPYYKSLFAEVWLWDDWPDKDGPDNGIDLVAETTDGGLWAIQSKCYKEQNRVPRDEVTSFLAESNQARFAERLLVSTTDRVAPNAERTIEKQEKPIRRFTREDFLTAPLDWSLDNWLTSNTPAAPKSKPTPRPYQVPVIANVAENLEERGQLIMACGTGKTLTSLWIDEAMDSELTLVLLPSLTLLSQTLAEWKWNTTPDFEPLAVCSDDSVTARAEEDQIALSATELAFPVTTDPAEIAAFMNGTGKRIVFSTYQSSPKIAEAQLDESVPAFDIVFADEAHRCAGKVSTAYSTVLDDEKLRANRRLFMTATPRVFTTRVRTKAAAHGVEVASMDDHSVFGPVVDRISFAQAIEKGMLTNYQVAVILVDDARIRELIEERNLVETAGGKSTDAASLAGRVGFLKAVKDFGLQRTISFHSRVKAAERFAKDLPDVAGWMPAAQRPAGTVHAGFVSGAMSASNRNAGLNQLRNIPDGEHGVLANARCLSEGVDVPSLDGVAFIDPRRSQVDIVQAVGRAIRLAPGKKHGTIVIPVYVSSADDPAVVLDGSEFKPVWDVVNALRSHDDDLAEELDELRLSLGKRQPSGLKLPDKIVIDAPESVGVEFSTALRTVLVERTTDDWLNWYAALQQYVEREGNANVPRGHAVSFDGEDLNLDKWVDRQRTDFKKGKLSAEREALLLAVGFEFDPNESFWQKNYAALKQYVEREGSANVPHDHVVSCDGEDLNLGQWVGRQRADFKKEKLSSERVRLLLAVGFEFDALEAVWQKNYAALKQYVDREGSANVPKGRSESFGGEDLKLGVWVDTQRTDFKKGKVSSEREALLLAVGFEFDPYEAFWQKNYAALKQYIEDEGSANIPAKYVEVFDGEDLKLGAWVSTQRADFKKEKLPSERVRLLLAVGFEFDPQEAAWQKNYAALKQYTEREGSANVPQGHVVSFDGEDLNLGAWVSNQRKALKREKLSSEREALLLAVGFELDPNEAFWQKSYAALKQYTEREGNANAPQGHVESFGGEDLKLGKWVNKQRAFCRKGKLSSEREALLLAVGFEFDPYEAFWQKNYAALKQYVECEDSANVPQGHVVSFDGEDLNLGVWVSNQRTAFKKGKLDPERKRLLGDLPGWRW